MGNNIVRNYRQAREALDDAEVALATLVAEYIDNHPELDTTGEWRRMSELFGFNHIRSWFFEADSSFATFEKTTNRGLWTHTITVNIKDLGE